MAPAADLPDSLPDALRHFMPTSDNGDIDANPSARELYREYGSSINEYPPDKPYNIALEAVPVTVERMPFVPSADCKLVDPGTPRVNIAADAGHPEGTLEADWAKRHKNLTAVQQHCLYFDQDGDGVIWPQDTFIACRKWGWGILLSSLATFIINVNLSYPTGTSWLPDPFFRIHIYNLHKCKHGSDSMSYDNEGRFQPQKYEDMFAKYDRGHKGGLDRSDLLRAHKGQRMCMDFFGWSASFLECTSSSRGKHRFETLIS